MFSMKNAGGYVFLADMLILSFGKKGPKILADMLILAGMLWRLCHTPL